MRLYNGRIIHLEDLLFEGREGLSTILNAYSDLTRTVQGSAHEDFQISMKIDGSPSILFGNNPKTNEFFVSTKSIFNKEPKINFTYEDIQRNHPDSFGLQHTLNVCLEHLPNTDKIVQADVLYTKDELFEETIDGIDYILFKPNTITYGVRKDSPLSENIQTDLGFVYHTVYQHDLLVENASLDTDGLNFESPHFWCRDASITVDPEKLSKEEIDSVIEMDGNLYNCFSNHDLNQLIHIIPKKQYLQKFLYSYVFECVKSNQRILHTPGFIAHITRLYEERAEACKTPEGKDNNFKNCKEIVRDIRNLKEMPNLFTMWNEISIHKTECLMSIFEQTPFSIKSFLYDGEKYIPYKPEGYVLNKDYTVKIVDRFEFTKANYDNTKWK